jgi:hypothetical protein
MLTEPPPPLAGPSGPRGPSRSCEIWGLAGPGRGCVSRPALEA